MLPRAQQVRKLQRSYEAILAAVGARDEDHLRQLAERHGQRIALQQKRQRLTEQITAAVGRQCSEEAVISLLASRGEGEQGGQQLERHWDQLVSQLHEAQAQLAQLLQRRGAIDQEMKSTAEDRRLAQARLELGCVEQQLSAAVERWRVLAITQRLLESIREAYEKEHNHRPSARPRAI